MPKKSIDKIYRYVHELVLAGGDLITSTSYGEYRMALTTLTDKLKTFYEKDATGKLPVLSQKDIQSLKLLYRSAISKGNDLLSEEKDDRRHIKQLNHIVTQVNQILTEEMGAISGVLTDDKVTIEQLNNKAHSYVLDLTGKDRGEVRGAQSSRIPVKFQKDGKEHEGFFTEETTYDYDKDVEKLLNECSTVNGVLNPRYRKFYDKVMSNNGLLVRLTAGQAAEEGQKMGQVYNEMLDDLIDKGIDNPETLENFYRPMIERLDPSFMDLSADRNFTLSMFKFIKEYGLILSKKIVNDDYAHIEKGRPLEMRNAAFSAIADLLGASKVVARSVKMQVKDGDTIREGIFMEKAKGYDVRKLTPDNPLTKFAQKNLHPNAKAQTMSRKMSIQAVRDLANIQVLDYICGNIDRHFGNMLYDVDPKTGLLCGIQGIDNGESFGVLKAEDVVNGRNCLGGLNSIRTMNSAMAGSVLALTPEILRTTLRPFGLSEKEIDACIDRTKALQDKITFSRSNAPKEERREKGIMIFTPKNWKQVTPGYFLSENSLIGTMLYGFPRSIGTNIEKQKKDAQRKAFLDKVDKSLMAESETKYAEGNYYGTIPRDMKKEIADLKTELTAAKKGFFIGTKKFDKVEKALDAVLKLERKPEKDRSMAFYRALEAGYKELKQRTEFYLNEKRAEENELLMDGKAPSEHANKRVAFAENVLLFMEKQVEKVAHDKKVLAEKIKTRRELAAQRIRTGWEIIPRIQQDKDSEVKENVLNEIREENRINEAKVEKIDGNEENVSIAEIDDVKPVEPKKEQEKQVEKEEKEKQVEPNKTDDQPKL